MIYPTGALLIAPDGTAYRARQPLPGEYVAETIQELSVSRVDTSNSITRADDLPGGVRIIWEPSGIALPVDPQKYADDQERISVALALVDDLVQDAGDLGDQALMHTLANAYHAIERFRIIPGRPAPTSHVDVVEAAFEEASRAVPAEDLRFIRETYQEDGGEAAERYCDRLADGSVLTARISALGRLGRVLGLSAQPAPEQPSHADGSCGCPDPYCQA